MMVIDIKRAHFYATSIRRVFVQLPPEDPRYGEPGVCAELLQSMYGTRDAAANWEAAYTQVLVQAGFTRGQASPCHFWHEKWDVRVLVHGDDFVAIGPNEGLEKFRGMMEASYECKVESVGPGPEEQKELRVLGRIISYTEDGLRYEADPRHAEAVVEKLGLKDSNPAPTPAAKEACRRGYGGVLRTIRDGTATSEEKAEWQKAAQEEENPEELAAPDVKLYQSMSARLNYLAMDRADVMFSVKELMRKMAKPTEGDLSKLKRVARYLVGTPWMYQEFPWQQRSGELRAYVDSDFAGCQSTRKSTSGGCLLWGSHCLKSWAKTQAIIALSSGEAELAAVVRGSTEVLGMQSILRDFGIEVELQVHSDATAAIGMVKREGLGKVRHLAVADLWVQEKQRLAVIVYGKVDGKHNPADAMTKGVDGDTLQRHMRTMGFRKGTKRHPLAPKLIESRP